MASSDENDPQGSETKPKGAYNPHASTSDDTFALTSFHYIERAFLFLVALMTIGGAAGELYGIYQARSISLSDILMMFLYTEVIGMIAVFYSAGRSAFIYPILIAITALSRLILLQSKEMAPEKIVFEASAILLLALAARIFQSFWERSKGIK